MLVSNRIGPKGWNDFKSLQSYSKNMIFFIFLEYDSKNMERTAEGYFCCPLLIQVKRNTATSLSHRCSSFRLVTQSDFLPFFPLSRCCRQLRAWSSFHRHDIAGILYKLSETHTGSLNWRLTFYCRLLQQQ